MSVTGELVRSEIVDGAQEQIWEVPAFREAGAVRVARVNSRFKGLQNINVLNIEQIGTGRLPGQKIFRVTVEASR